jgi:integrase
MRKPELGAQVQKDSSTDTNWYIIPLCVKHSMRAEFIEIADTTILVSAQVGHTCAKQLPLGNIRAQDLRETLATNASSHGTDAAQVKDWLDHATSASTRLYGKRKEQPQATLPRWRMY